MLKENELYIKKITCVCTFEIHRKETGEEFSICAVPDLTNDLSFLLEHIKISSQKEKIKKQLKAVLLTELAKIDKL